MENIFAYLSMNTLISQYLFKKGGLARLNIVIGNGFICDHLLRVKESEYILSAHKQNQFMFILKNLNL